MSLAVTIAYLEISGRLTGKTHRMAKLACDVLAKGSEVVFVVCNVSMARDMRQRYPAFNVLVDGQSLPIGIDLDRAVWFYDEFDYQKSVVVREGAYYATTAARLRVAGAMPAEDDVLMRLLKVNGFRHERYLLPDDLTDVVTEHRVTMTPAQFRCAMLGEFQS